MKFLHYVQIGLAACLAAASFAGDAPPARPPIASFFNNPLMLQPVLSPSGHHLAWLQKSDGGRYILIAADTDNLPKMSVVAGFKNVDIVDTAWVNDDRLFFRVADKKDAFGKFVGNTYAINRDGSRKVQLTSANWGYNQDTTGTLIHSRILPAKYFYFSPAHDGSDDIIVEHAEFNNVDDSVDSTRLFRLNTKTLELTGLQDEKLPAKMNQWVLDANDKVSFAISLSQGRETAYRWDAPSNQWRVFSEDNAYLGRSFSPLFGDFDGNIYGAATYKHKTAALYKLKGTDTKLSAEPILSIPGYDFIGSPVFDYQGKKLLGIRYHNDASSTVWLNPHMKELQAKVDDILPNTVNSLYCSDCDHVPYVLVYAVSDRQPMQYYLYDSKNNTMVLLGNSLPDIKADQMGARDFDHYKARDGRQIPVYITTPPGGGKGPWPTVVLVHGGPFVRGSSWEWDSDAQFLASRGYLVIQPEFRGSAGFGFDHFKAGWRQWGQAMQDDLADAATWAVGKGMADPKRIAIAGASYGGYATLMGLIRNPEIFRCGFEWAGVADLKMMYTVAESDFSNDYLSYGAPQLIGDPDKDAEMFKANSPIENASRITQPLLLAYGGSDYRVPIAHGTAIRDAVRKHNDQVEWIVYPEEGHGWYFEKNRIDFWTRVEAFLDKNLAKAGKSEVVANNPAN